MSNGPQMMDTLDEKSLSALKQDSNNSLDLIVICELLSLQKFPERTYRLGIAALELKQVSKGQ